MVHQRASELLRDPRVLADERVKVLLANMRNAQTSADRLEHALMLEKFLLGEYSRLENPARADELQSLREDVRARDKAEEAYEADADAFLMDVYNRTEKNKLTGEKADQAKAEAGVMLKNARVNARANATAKKLWLDHEIAHGPKVTVAGQGHWMKIGPAETAVAKLLPDTVRIMHREWTIHPGVNKDVPKVFADRYQQILLSRQETQERERAMASPTGSMGLKAKQLERELSRIDDAYKVERDRVNI